MDRGAWARIHRGLVILLPLLCIISLGLGLGLSEDVAQEEERLIGWRGDSYKPQNPNKGKTWLQSISWKPRAFIVHNLITEAEAQHIVDLSWPKMRRSTVVGENGSDVLDDYRTSYGTFIARYQTPVVARIQDRVALFTRLPVVNQEDIQVLRYGLGQYYHKHTDSLDNDSPRMATLLIYLSDPEEGGETSFPDGSEWANPLVGEMYEPHLSECAKGHVAFHPRRGDALLFFSIHPDGKTEDAFSMHEGCPVTRGAKWTTTVWIHTLPFRPEEYTNGTFKNFREDFVDPGLCEDTSDKCELWQAEGECEKNPGFMVGTADQSGACMGTCGACEACSGEDKAARKPCYWNNRRRRNFLVFSPEELVYRRAEEGAQLTDSHS